MSDFIFLGSKITADGDCSHEIKRRTARQRTTLCVFARVCVCVRAHAYVRVVWAGCLCVGGGDRKSTRLNSSHSGQSRMPSSA